MQPKYSNLSQNTNSLVACSRILNLANHFLTYKIFFLNHRPFHLKDMTRSTNSRQS